jgi:hypothetical protein
MKFKQHNNYESYYRLNYIKDTSTGRKIREFYGKEIN